MTSPRRAGAAALALLVFAAFVVLGSWQLQRRAWKLDLIGRVEQRVHAQPVAAPGPDLWPLVSAAGDEYRRVQVIGEFLHERETLVQATTELGSGFWVLTPLRMADGTLVLVNRGFVPPERRERAARTASETISKSSVTGLLRITEPGGAFLRRNDPGANRWYSRDVQAIAAARGLTRVAPYFIDADAAARLGDKSGSGPSSWPVGGLTVIAFQDNHLVYAITWYALAVMAAVAAWRVIRKER